MACMYQVMGGYEVNARHVLLVSSAYVKWKIA